MPVMMLLMICYQIWKKNDNPDFSNYRQIGIYEAAVSVLIVRGTPGLSEHMYDISLPPIVLCSIIIL